MALLKRLMIGRPLPTAAQDEQRLPKTIALATFSSDPISSTAYATEEILFVTAVGASSLSLGVARLVPMSVAVAVLLAIVVTSYRQTIRSYPGGGGAYIVARKNLGEYPSLVAGASLLIDYVLTVAVSVSAGVAALISLPAFRHLAPDRVLIGLLFIAVLTLGNLRGLKEAGRVFAVPTYVYILVLGGLVAYGLYRVYFGDIEPVPFDQEAAEGVARAGGSLSLFLLLRGFSSGAVALSGVEAISNGVPAFRRPESKNAATTLVAMGLILGTLFFGVSLLASHLSPYPSHDETVISQLGRAVFGEGLLHTVLQFATAAILVLAANTAYVDFPRLSSIIAADGYLPRQFAIRGDRLVFSNGIVFLALAAGALLVAFRGLTNLLIPLYAVGVFTSFTLSQAGMVRHHRREREPNWRRGVAINATGAVATGAVLLVVAVTKFAVGAWLPIVVVPAVIAGFKAVRRHYARVEKALAVRPEAVRPRSMTHAMVVLVGQVHRGTVEALDYARSLRPDHLVALSVVMDEADAQRRAEEWLRFGFDVPLELVEAPYRDLVGPVRSKLDELAGRWPTGMTTVVIPEFVVGLRSLANVLHGQSALGLKLALLERPRTAVLSVPFHVRSADGEHLVGRADEEPGLGSAADDVQALSQADHGQAVARNP